MLTRAEILERLRRREADAREQAVELRFQARAAYERADAVDLDAAGLRNLIREAGDGDAPPREDAP